MQRERERVRQGTIKPEHHRGNLLCVFVRQKVTPETGEHKVVVGISVEGLSSILCCQQ